MDAYSYATALDFSREWTKIDVKFLEDMIQAFHSGVSEERKKAAGFLTHFMNNEDAWRRTSEVLRCSNHSKTKYFVLDIFAQFIKLKWRHLSCPQQLGFKKYVLTLLMMKTSIDKLSEEDEAILGKLNNILLQILDYEYPENWPTFMEDFLSASKTNDIRCLNSLVVLNHMSEKVLGTKKQISWLKAKEIRESNADIFSNIFFMCEYVVNARYDSKLLKYALETMLRFILWIPPRLLIQTCFIKVLIHRFNMISDRCLTLRLLIATVHMCPPRYNVMLVSIFSQYVACQVKMPNLSVNFKEAYAQNLASFRKELHYQIIFLTNILKKHGELIRRKAPSSFDIALGYLISISLLDDVKLVKLCMEYFNIFVRHLCSEKFKRGCHDHKPIISKLRRSIIIKFLKPEKIALKDDKGQVVKQTCKAAPPLKNNKGQLVKQTCRAAPPPKDDKGQVIKKISKVAPPFKDDKGQVVKKIFKVAPLFKDDKGQVVKKISKVALPFKDDKGQVVKKPSKVAPPLKNDKEQVVKETCRAAPPLKDHKLQVVKETCKTAPSFKNDKGQVVKETCIAAPVQIFTNMKLILVFLTYLDHAETLKVIIQGLYNQIKNRKFSEKRLKSLCCAAVQIKGKSVRIKGSIIRCIPRKEEEKFFWTIMRGLLTLSKVIRGRNNKKILAFNLMNIIGEYAEYLNSRWNVLKRVIIKLSDFMHEKQKDTKDLACKTFISVAQKCKEKILKRQRGEDMSYFDKILRNMGELPSVLNPQQVFYFYEAVGHITVVDSLQADDKIVKERIRKAMALQNVKWEKILNQTKKSTAVLHHPRFINDILYMLYLNSSACKGMGFEYVYQLHNIYKDMLMLYENMGKKIYNVVKKKSAVIKHPRIKAMRTVRKEILKLISTWVSSIKKTSQCDTFLVNFLPHLINCVLRDYLNCTLPSLREPEVLSLLTAIVNSLKDSAIKEIERFFSFVLDCTANSIIKKQEEFMEITKNFFLFIHAVITHCFKALEELTTNVTFEKILDLIIWSIKFCKKETATLGLKTLLLLLEKIKVSQKSQLFYQTFYLLILENVLFLVTNPLHRSDLPHKALILSHLFKLISRDMKKPINPVEQKNMPNGIYIQHYVANFIHLEFKDLTEEQLEFVTNGFFKYHLKIPSLVEYLKNLPALIEEFCEENIQEAATKPSSRCKQAVVTKENVQKLATNSQAMAKEKVQKLVTNSQAVTKENVQKVAKNSLAMTKENVQKVPTNSQAVTKEIVQKVPTNSKAVTKENVQKVPTNSQAVTKEIVQKVPTNSKAVTKENVQKVPTNSQAVTKEIVQKVPTNSKAVTKENVQKVPTNSQAVTKEIVQKVPTNSKAVTKENVQKVPTNSQAVTKEIVQKVPMNSKAVTKENVQKVPTNSQAVTKENVQKVATNFQAVTKEIVQKVPTNSQAVTKDNVQKVPTNSQAVTKENVQRVGTNSQAVTKENVQKVATNSQAVTKENVQKAATNSQAPATEKKEYLKST